MFDLAMIGTPVFTPRCRNPSIPCSESGIDCVFTLGSRGPLDNPWSFRALAGIRQPLDPPANWRFIDVPIRGSTVFLMRTATELGRQRDFQDAGPVDVLRAIRSV